MLSTRDVRPFEMRRICAVQSVAGVEQRKRQRVGAAYRAASAEFEIVALLTTVNRTYERVAMHAVRESLLEMQAAAAGLPLVKVPIPSPCPNETYERAMATAMARARAEGVWHVVFRRSVSGRCSRLPRKAASALRHDAGFSAVGKRHAATRGRNARGRTFGVSHLRGSAEAGPQFRRATIRRGLLRTLPAGVDPCGENGEFHTFANEGPMFKQAYGIGGRDRGARRVRVCRLSSASFGGR